MAFGPSMGMSAMRSRIQKLAGPDRLDAAECRLVRHFHAALASCRACALPGGRRLRPPAILTRGAEKRQVPVELVGSFAAPRPLQLLLGAKTRLAQIRSEVTPHCIPDFTTDTDTCSVTSYSNSKKLTLKVSCNRYGEDFRADGVRGLQLIGRTAGRFRASTRPRLMKRGRRMSAQRFGTASAHYTLLFISYSLSLENGICSAEIFVKYWEENGAFCSAAAVKWNLSGKQTILVGAPFRRPPSAR